MITISPSQLKTEADCPRKWGLYRLDRIKEVRPPRVNKEGTPLPDKPDFGSAVHKELEDWADGRNEFSPNEAGSAASKLAKVAMPPGVGVSEGEFHLVVGSLPDGTPVAISGVCDRRAGPGEFDDLPVAVADDYKTTGDYKWSLTPELMIKDPQVLTYVVYVASKYGSTKVLARWLYVRLDWKKDGTLPAAKSTRVVKRLFDLRDAEFREEWEKIVAKTMELAAKVHAGETAGQQKQNPLSCMKFGGCGYRDTACHPSQGDTLTAYITQWKRRDQGLDSDQTLYTLSSKKESDMNIMDLVDDIAKKNKPAEPEKAEVVAPTALAGTEREEPPKKKAPRKPKDKVEAKLPEVNAPESALDSRALDKGPAQVPSSAADAPITGGHLLYIDCVPTKGATAIPLADILKPLKAQLQGDGVHWSIKQGEHFVDRKAKLEAMLLVYLQSASPMAITCSRHDDDGRMLLGALMSSASMVVSSLG